jgi:hypothetical protein
MVAIPRDSLGILGRTENGLAEAVLLQAEASPAIATTTDWRRMGRWGRVVECSILEAAAGVDTTVELAHMLQAEVVARATPAGRTFPPGLG